MRLEKCLPTVLTSAESPLSADPLTSADSDLSAALAVLMGRAQDGDAAAYRALLLQVTPLVRRAVRAKRRFLPAADVEDLTQDVLLSLHAVRATYDPQRPFLPWLMAIVRHRLADGGRKQMRRNAHEVAGLEGTETFADAGANSEAVIGDPEALRQAIDSLPEGQRKAIEMVKLKEMTLKEASAATGTSVSALKVAVHRAVKALRLTLTAQG